MKSQSLIAAVVALAGVAALGAQGGPSTTPLSPEVELKVLRTRALLDGNAREAIENYRAIADRYRATRPEVAAEARLQMARTASSLDPIAGRAAYEDVLREFGNVPAAAVEARAALDAAVDTQTGPQPARRVTSGSVVARGISADGRWLFGMSGRQEIVRQDIVSGEITVVLSGDGANRVNVNSPVVSPDGQYLALRVVSPSQQNQTGRVSTVDVVRLSDGTRREVVGPDTDRPGIPYPLAWSADGRSLLILNQGFAEQNEGNSVRLSWFNVEDGSSARIAAFPEWRNVGPILDAPKGGLSPDGQFIAFSAVAREGGADRQIVVMNARGGNETPVVQMAGRHFDPIWSPDGGRLFFVSDRSGNRALWSVPMSGGRATGEPAIVKSEIGRQRLVGMSTTGDLFVEESLGEGEQHVFVAERTGADAVSVVSAFPGSRVTWSTDNRTVAFTRRGSGGTAVAIRDLDTGAEQTFEHPGLQSTGLRWVPGTSSVLVHIGPAGDDGRAGGSMYLLDTRTGTFTWLFALEATGLVRDHGAYAVSADGTTVYIATKEAARGGRFTGVVAIDMASRTERRVATFTASAVAGLGSGTALAVSPDGTRLVVEVVADEAGTATGPLRRQLVSIQADGTGHRPLGQPFVDTFNPGVVAWTPDGQQVLFLTCGSENWKLMRLGPEGREAQFAGLDATRVDSTARLPRFAPGCQGKPQNLDVSPDGRRMAFSGQTAVTRELWSFDNLLVTMNSR